MQAQAQAQARQQEGQAWNSGSCSAHIFICGRLREGLGLGFMCQPSTRCQACHITTQRSNWCMSGAPFGCEGPRAVGAGVRHRRRVSIDPHSIIDRILSNGSGGDPRGRSASAMLLLPGADGTCGGEGTRSHPASALLMLPGAGAAGRDNGFHSQPTFLLLSPEQVGPYGGLNSFEGRKPCGFIQDRSSIFCPSI